MWTRTPHTSTGPPRTTCHRITVVLLLRLPSMIPVSSCLVNGTQPPSVLLSSSPHQTCKWCKKSKARLDSWSSGPFLAKHLYVHLPLSCPTQEAFPPLPQLRPVTSQTSEKIREFKSKVSQGKGRKQKVNWSRVFAILTKMLDWPTRFFMNFRARLSLETFSNSIARLS